MWLRRQRSALIKRMRARAGSTAETVHQPPHRHDRHAARRSPRDLRRANVATPHIDRLAREGAWAPQAVVHAPLTRPSHARSSPGCIRPSTVSATTSHRRFPRTCRCSRRSSNATRSQPPPSSRLPCSIGSRVWRVDSLSTAIDGSQRRPPRRRSGGRRRDRLAEGPGGRPASSPGSTCMTCMRPTSRPRRSSRAVCRPARTTEPSPGPTSWWAG